MSERSAGKRRVLVDITAAAIAGGKRVVFAAYDEESGASFALDVHAKHGVLPNVLVPRPADAEPKLRWSDE